jgi:hypothetical protein
MRLRHFVFGLLCFMAAGILSTRQTVDTYRTGYRIEELHREKARLEEARGRLEAALALHRRPDRLLERAAEMSIPLVDPIMEED